MDVTGKKLGYWPVVELAEEKQGKRDYHWRG